MLMPHHNRHLAYLASGLVAKSQRFSLHRQPHDNVAGALKAPWLWVSLLGISVITGCTATPSAHLFDEQSPSMQSIYDEHMRQTQGDDTAALRETVAAATPVPAPAVWHTAAESLNETTFVQLPNPAIAMTVLPQLQGEEQLPIPAYTTQFSLYTRDHYALPGEAPGVQYG